MNEGDKLRIRAKLWEKLRRPEQVPPNGFIDTWYCRGGRGSGKTRTGAETLGGWIADNWDTEGDWAVVAPTFGDARDTCMEGPSGLLRVLAGRYDPTRWNRSHGQLHLDNGATVFCDGANDGAERIQGKNLKGAWADEVGLWRISMEDQVRVGTQAQDFQVKAWDESLAFAIRMPPGFIVATGTPKRGHPLVRKLINDPRVVVTLMRMEDNIANLLPARVEELQRRYANTALGAQELGGEFLDSVEGAYWTIAQIDACRIDPDRFTTEDPARSKTVTAIDPPGGETEAGIVTVARTAGPCMCGVQESLPHAYVLADDSLLPSGPNHWASVGIEAYYRLNSTRLVGEVNYGGDMVENTVSNIDSTVRTGIVRASKGKLIRAEPVAGLYGDPSRPETWDKTRIHHVGMFPELEAEMTNYSLAVAGKWSPNRLDALVWAVAELDMDQISGGVSGRARSSASL